MQFRLWDDHRTCREQRLWKDDADEMHLRLHPPKLRTSAFRREKDRQGYRLRHAGIIIETPRFIDYYSGMKNLKVLCGLSGKPDVAKLKETLSMCGLDPELRISVRKYSLGMRQRLALAQAIMEDQKVLILDEPFNGLDKHGIAEMRTLLLQLKEKGHLIILSSHNAEDVKLLCDHVIEMENGVILRAGK